MKNSSDIFRVTIGFQEGVLSVDAKGSFGIEE
jgi:hypothetical protein